MQLQKTVDVFDCKSSSHYTDPEACLILKPQAPSLTHSSLSALHLSTYELTLPTTHERRFRSVFLYRIFFIHFFIYKIIFSYLIQYVRNNFGNSNTIFMNLLGELKTLYYKFQSLFRTLGFSTFQQNLRSRIYFLAYDIMVYGLVDSVDLTIFIYIYKDIFREEFKENKLK